MDQQQSDGPDEESPNPSNRDKIATLDLVPGPENPTDPVPCDNCGEPIRRDVVSLHPWGDVLRLHACACRLWAEWIGPGLEPCPICVLLDHPDRELVHTHEKPRVMETDRQADDVDADGDRWGQEGSVLPTVLAEDPKA